MVCGVYEAMSQDSTEDRKPAVWLRGRDQTSIGVLTAGALALMAAYWWAHGGHRGELIDIDRAEPLVARFQIDVNHAEWPELIQLPGIGPTLALRLIDDRRQRGEFRSVDDLTRVHGIGPLKLQRIRPYVLPIAGSRQVVGP
jgi:competence protein ComEA